MLNLPVNLVTKLKQEARKLGISHIQLFSMIIEDKARKNIKLREMIEKKVVDGLDKGIAPALFSALRGKKGKHSLPN